MGHPSDSKLVKHFLDHEKIFNQLIEMSNQDPKVVRIADNFTRLKNNWNWPRSDNELGFSKERWEEYKLLFKKVGLEAGLTRQITKTDDVIIFFTISANGLSVSGSEKGYVYSLAELGPLYNSLDHLSQKDIPQGTPAYKRLKEHWYLYYSK